MTSTSLLFILQNLQSVRFCEGAAGEAYFNIRDGLFVTNQGIGESGIKVLNAASVLFPDFDSDDLPPLPDDGSVKKGSVYAFAYQDIEDIPNFERKNVKENSDGTISVTYHGTRPVINRDESYDDEDYFDVTFRLVRDDNNVF